MSGARHGLATAGLFAAAATLAVVLRREDPDRALAVRLIGPVESVPGFDPPAFRSGRRAVLFFERPGVQGRIRGAVVLDGDAISDVLLLENVEGHDGRALRSPEFAGAFRGRAARPPVVVDSVTGASISSRAVIDAVNDRLRRWAEARAR